MDDNRLAKFAKNRKPSYLDGLQNLMRKLDIDITEEQAF